MCEDCKRHLAEPELRLITPTVHLLRAIAVASDPACALVVSSVLPTIIQQITVETKVACSVRACMIVFELDLLQVSRQRVLLESLHVFIMAVSQFAVGDGEFYSGLVKYTTFTTNFPRFFSHDNASYVQRFLIECADVSKYPPRFGNPCGIHSNTWSYPTDSGRFRKVRGELNKNYAVPTLAMMDFCLW